MRKAKQILLVEENALLRGTLRDALSGESVTVLEAENGEEGLRVSLREHPDLILLDILMPKMSGIEMAKRLREDLWGKTAKIIILSNSTDAEKVEQAVECDIFTYLVKSDIGIDNLLKKVRETI